MKDVIDAHPEALGVAIEQDRQEDGERHADEYKQEERSPGLKGQRNSERRQKQFGKNQIDRYRARKIALFPLEMEAANRAVIVHFEPAGKNPSLTTDRAGQTYPPPDQSEDFS